MIDWKPTPNPDQGTEATGAEGLMPLSSRGRLAQTWWSQRLVEPLDSLPHKPTVEAGRRLARKGSVLNMQISPGSLAGTVQETPDQVFSPIVHLPRIADEIWRDLIPALIARIDLTAALLADTMPRDIDDFFAAHQATLFPDDVAEWQGQCTCDDEQTPCKHAIAIVSMFADRFDAEPCLLLYLRGRGRHDLQAALRQSWGAPAEGLIDSDNDDDVLVTDLNLSTYYRLQGQLGEYAGPPPPPEGVRVIRRLGFPPFFPPGDRTVQQTLENLYEE